MADQRLAALRGARILWWKPTTSTSRSPANYWTTPALCRGCRRSRAGSDGHGAEVHRRAPAGGAAPQATLEQVSASGAGTAASDGVPRGIDGLDTLPDLGSMMGKKPPYLAVLRRYWQGSRTSCTT